MENSVKALIKKPIAAMMAGSTVVGIGWALGRILMNKHMRVTNKALYIRPDYTLADLGLFGLECAALTGKRLDSKISTIEVVYRD